MKKKNSVYRLTLLSLLIAVAMLLSYIEHLLPSFVPIPGVKLGLANVATVFALYILGVRFAVSVSLVRIVLSALLFGNVLGLVYALSGATLALLGMCLLKKMHLFSEVGVSVVGGVFHNVGQIIAAAAVMKTAGLVLVYLPVLLVSGTVAGIAVGVVSGLVIRALKNKISKII